MVAEQLRKIEDQAANFLIEALREVKKVEGVLIAKEGFGARRGEPPTAAEIETLRKEFNLDAVLYGQIPSYGKMPLIYPIVAETIDISTETLIIGVATGWYLPVVLGNVGLELLTNTPLWFGGAYVFGWAFRPVTVEARVLSTADGKEVWHESVDKFSAKKILETYPPLEQSKKEIQLEASLLKAIRSLAKSLSE